MNNVAFVTYNSVGDNLSSGWHESNGRRALVLQNTRGEGTRQSGPIGTERRREEISLLWGKLQEELPHLDHVVVYVGMNGSERAIALAAQLSTSKVTFVGCDCGLLKKEAMVQAVGMTDARRMLCECGGHRTMYGLYEQFMQTGELLPVVR